MINCNFYGYVGKNPETKATQNGSIFATFSVGCNAFGKQESTWINVSVNSKSKSYDYILNNIKSGDLVYISGNPFATGYVSKKDNKVKALLNVFADKVEMILSKKNSGIQQDTTTPSIEEFNENIALDIPF